jgi:hypothetical protein
VPVEIRHGVTDVLVPAPHGKWLATQRMSLVLRCSSMSMADT